MPTTRSSVGCASWSAGAPDGLCPAGLGARDTLRLEKAYPLYGHELDDTTTPLEAGLAWVTKFSKPNFIGRDILLRQKEAGVKRKLVGLEMFEPGIARSGYGLFKRRTIDRPGDQRHQVAVSRQIDRARLCGIGRVGTHRACRSMWKFVGAVTCRRKSFRYRSTAVDRTAINA